MEHYVITTSGSAQRLSSVIVTTPTADIPSMEKSYSYISIQAGAANAAAAYVGGFNQLLSSSVYGIIIPIPVSTVPAAPLVFQASSPSLRFSQIQVLGANAETLKILAY